MCGAIRSSDPVTLDLSHYLRITTLVRIPRLLFLEISAVRQQNFTKISGRRRAIYLPSETILNKPSNKA
jgi:hypothetical protein